MDDMRIDRQRLRWRSAGMDHEDKQVEFNDSMNAFLKIYYDPHQHCTRGLPDVLLLFSGMHVFPGGKQDAIMTNFHSHFPQVLMQDVIMLEQPFPCVPPLFHLPAGCSLVAIFFRQRRHRKGKKQVISAICHIACSVVVIKVVIRNSHACREDGLIPNRLFPSVPHSFTSWRSWPSGRIGHHTCHHSGHHSGRHRDVPSHACLRASLSTCSQPGWPRGRRPRPQLPCRAC